MHRRGGPRSHPGMVSPGWGLSTLRLVWDTCKAWTLHQGCSRGRSRRCLGTLSWGAVGGSPESACAISGRGPGLTPGPGSMPSAGANHGGRLSTGTGPKWGGAAGAAVSVRLRCAEGDCDGDGVSWGGKVKDGCRCAAVEGVEMGRSCGCGRRLK